jgi:hypothetical protein
MHGSEKGFHYFKKISPAVYLAENANKRGTYANARRDVQSAASTGARCAA